MFLFFAAVATVTVQAEFPDLDYRATATVADAEVTGVTRGHRRLVE